MSSGISSNGGMDRQSANDRPDSSPIRELIRTTRLWLRSSWVATGLGLTVGLLLSVLLLVALADLAITLWPSMRLAGLLLIVVPASAVLLLGVVRPLFRRLTAVLVARRIEKEIPGIHNRLVSCVDLDENDRAQPASPAFHRRLVKEAIERIKNFRVQRVIDLVSLRRAGIFAASAVAALFVALAIFSDRLPTAVARILQPFEDIPPASGVEYDVLVGEQTEPGDYETLRGENVDFAVLLQKGEVDPPGGEDPLRLKIETVDDEGEDKTLWYQFARLEENRTSFRLTGMQDSFSFRVYGGGTWSRQRRVTMLDRPRIVGLQTKLHYPDYMRITEPLLGPPQTIDVAGPIDSRVEIAVEVEGDASEGEIELLQRQTRLVDVLDRPERVWFGEKIPEGAAAVGKWEWDEKLIGQKGHTDAAAGALHAHGFHNAPVGFEVLPGESLFADVFIPADQPPETIMLKWHDGKDWEHRAYWGADKIQEGKADTAGKRHLGELPPAGKLVRLEVPAAALDLDGKRLHGISFALFGGRAVWGAAGTLPAAQREVTELAVTESVLLKPELSAVTEETTGPQTWSGSFPLLHDGFYRVVLRNRLGDANQQMKEGRLTAIRDNPPQVAIERPGAELLLSAPVKVPIYISAYDDFGLDAIVLSVQNGESSSFQGRPVKHFERPQRSAANVVTLDLAEEELKVGDTLRYRVEVRDGKGQTATTADYSIRLADDNQAADRQIAEYEKKTDTFQEKLAELIAEQEKVQESVAELAEKFEPLTEKIEQAKVPAAEKAALADPKNPKTPDQLTPDEVAKAIELDPEAAKELEQLRGELAEIAKKEDQNIQLGKQVAAELKQLAEQSPQQQLLPPEIARQLQGVEKAFEQMAVKPLEQLGEQMKKGAQPAQKDPQLAETKRQSELVQRNLKDLQERLRALKKAQEQSGDDVEKALADLKRDLMRQNADLTARELAELKDFIAAMRKDLKNLKGDQEELLDDGAKDLSKRLLERLKEEQQQLDKKSDEKLAAARELLDSKELKELAKRMPPQPDKPAANADEPAKDDPKGNEKPDEAKQQEKKPDEGKAKEDPKSQQAKKGEKPPFVPALGGPVPKPDPRLAEKMKKLAQAGKQKTKDAGEKEKEAGKLQSRQLERVENLDLAEKALGSDQETLEEFLAQLEAAADETPPADRLAEMMKSLDARQALAMLERMREMLTGSDRPADPKQAQLPEPSLNPEGNLTPLAGGVEELLVEIDDLDLDARAVIMKMQPRVREELLQGLREEGPEGYRKFIRDYFRQLTKVNANPRKK